MKPATEGGQPPPYSTQLPNVPPGPMPPVVTCQAFSVQNQLSFHDRPIQLLCPACNKMIVTRISCKAGALTWLSCVCCCLFGGLVCCFLIPFCVDTLRDVDHFCPSCNTLLGTYKRL